MPPPEEIPRSEGRVLFGSDPATYDAARPDYPDRVFETLRERGGLVAGATVFEIGAGTGKATRRFAEAGAGRVVALEPDPALAAYLRSDLAASARIEVIAEPFEDAAIEPEAFDLVAAATSFHWIDQPSGLAKVHRSLRPGGLCALFWNVFGDPDRHDALHEATQQLLGGLAYSPMGWAEGVPFPLDRASRIADLDAAGFVDIESVMLPWTLELDASQTCALYATFSPISRLDEGERVSVLAELGRIVDDQFGGRAVRNMVSAVYTGRKPLSPEKDD